MYKDLILNRDNIGQAIDLFCKSAYSNYTVSEEELANCRRYHITFDGKNMFLDVYYNNKGGTTLAVNNGKNVEEKKKLAQFIKDSEVCAMSDGVEHNRSILFKNIDREDFEKIIETLNDEEDCKSIVSRDENENGIIVRMEGRWNDKITVSYHFGTHNVRLQGRPLLLYSLCSSLFNELIDVEDVVECLDNAYALSLSGKAIEEQYAMLLPKSCDKHSAKLKKSLLKAVYNLNLDQQEYTCTELVFEALRALEGHIKLTLLRDYSIMCPNKIGSLSFFAYNSTDHTVSINSAQELQIAVPAKIQYYKDAYKFFVEYRHKIFHWDYPDTIATDSTEQLDDVEDAKSIIRDVLALIDRYY